MKMEIGMYEVEIKAKTKHENRYNKESAMSFLNWLSIIFYESAARYESKGCNAISKENYEIARLIYQNLEKEGLYK